MNLLVYTSSNLLFNTTWRTMNTEIELKYLIPGKGSGPDVTEEAITGMLTAQAINFEADEKQLDNDYFDSDHLVLRSMNIRLRIRSQNGVYEQTIKTAGKVVGCMHQWPEYNVDIANNNLDLGLFPKQIWPNNINLLALQKSMKVLFTTNFHRKTWIINLKGCVIELALDRGTISTAPDKPILAIDEIEIELVSGDKKELFILAEQLNNIIELQPGKLSKAARGYSLYYENK